MLLQFDNNIIIHVQDLCDMQTNLIKFCTFFPPSLPPSLMHSHTSWVVKQAYMFEFNSSMRKHTLAVSI